MAMTDNELRLTVLPCYLCVTVLIGWLARGRHAGANDFLNASGSLPLGIAAASFLAANCGALELVGLSAMAAQFGVQAFHFYWIGAIPAMVFLGVFMLPIYMRSGAKSVPEYLEQRYDMRVRLINSWFILVTGVALSGISLYAMAQVLHVVFGWHYSSGVLLAAGTVLIYVFLGGVRATIYNEVFQLTIIVLGILPLWRHPQAVLMRASHLLGSQQHLWLSLPVFNRAATLDQFGVIAGLGLVLSFSYWSTDFVLMQRALTTRSVAEGRLVPLLAGFGKLAFSILLVVPSLGAARLLGGRMPASFDQTLPALMVFSYGPVLLSAGVTAILASLMSGLAANVSAFSAVWTEEIYRRSLYRSATEVHYLRVGRLSILVAVLFSIGSSYLAFSFHNLMEYVQLIFSLFSAPFFGIFFAGIVFRRATSRGAIAGLFSGVSLALVHHGLVFGGVLVYGSLMSANFHVAVYAFLAALAITMLVSKPRSSEAEEPSSSLASIGAHGQIPPSRVWWLFACLLLLTCGVLNYIWR
jgi:solute:Na+ symporter, SSS family